ncbi:MAG TPA: flagellar hook-basal body complex protein [Phycisphaerae bacterium]|nr:flagellar hook-basal body complex protein [Phycisphaerae bacterium]
MGLTSSLFTGLSGLNASQFRLDIIGDNIANINTTGFKGSRTIFQTQFARTLAAGTKPSGTQGGTNPVQIGLGATIGSIQRSFTPGSVETTGVPSDLAIEGDGFFVLRTPENERVFTRDGGFVLSADNRLLSVDGFFVQGYSVTSDFDIVPGAVGDISIPLGVLTTARGTETVQLDGTVDSSGSREVATQGTILTSDVLYNATTGVQLNDITGPGTALTNIRTTAGIGAGLFANGDVITMSGVSRGGRDVPNADFVVGTTGTTVADFLAWMDEVVGIDTTTGVGGNPGTGVTTDGRMELRGNVGTQNALSIQAGELTSTGATQVPFLFNEAQAANGESTHTTFVVYDSLGSPMTVDMTLVLESRDTSTATWRFYVGSGDDSDLDYSVGTGTVTFDGNGQFVESPSNSFLMNRVGTGANDPQSVSIDFSRLSGLAVSGDSTVVMSFQDGFSTGTLLDYSIGEDGVITGTFSNGLNQTLGQIAVATFANQEGLLARSNNVYFVGPNSGDARITPPLTLGAGKVTAGALELSNVDLSREFINLITSSTAFSAASRIISTSDQLLQELLLVARR